MGLNYGFQGKKIRPSNLINHFISLFNIGEDPASSNSVNLVTMPKNVCTFRMNAYYLPQ